MTQREKDRCRRMAKRSLFFLTGLALLILPGLSFGQGELPCYDGDPYNTPCPIDSWVVVLGLITAAVTVVHLYLRKTNTETV